MGKINRPSFRQVLLSRILLLSIPILLVGEMVIYRNARSSLVETVHRNLSESAIRKGQEIQEAIAALQTNLLTAGNSTILQTGAAAEIQAFLTQLQPGLPGRVRCIQLTDLKTSQMLANTCPDKPGIQLLRESRSHWQRGSLSQSIGPESAFNQDPAIWPPRKPTQFLDRTLVDIVPIGQIQASPLRNSHGQLRLILSAPVYDQAGQLRYALSIQTTLQPRQVEGDRPGSLTGYAVVLDQDGTILAHPDGQQVGRSIDQEYDIAGFRQILNNGLSGNFEAVHLMSMGKMQGEWIAGYTSIQVPLTNDRSHTWLILAVSRWDSALTGLAEIKQIMVVLTLGLVTTIFLATLYLSRELSRPLEQLGHYALHIYQRHRALSPALKQSPPESLSLSTDLPPAVLTIETVPQDLRIRELDQLAAALDSMVHCLEDRARELETAWQEAEAANRLKSEFLANTSHELRTPLNAIIGCIRLVRDGCCDDREEEEEFLQRADEAAIHLLNIINDLLDLAKIEAGTLAIFVEPIDLCQALTEVINLQTVHIQQKRLQLSLPTLSEPIAVRADAAKLKQVLLNVICNAVKFTEQGGITLTIRTDLAQAAETGSKTPARAIVTITDTGIGIDPTQQHKLFQPFVMADGTTTRKHEGTGLGLAISRNLMRLMGGDITLQSAGEGTGTTVEIALPLIPAEELTTRSPLSPASMVQGHYVEMT